MLQSNTLMMKDFLIDGFDRVCWCAKRRKRRLRWKVIPALMLVCLAGILYGDFPSLPSAADDFYHSQVHVINDGHADRPKATSPPQSDVLNIVSLASAPYNITSDVTFGDVPFNVSAPETARCWRRLRRRLGRPPSLVVVGDSRARGLYHHLRTSWRLKAHTRRGFECLEHFVYKNRTDWCHYRASSPYVDLRFFWQRLADGGLLKLLQQLAASCLQLPASCPQLVLLSLGTHQLTVPEATNSRKLLAAVTGLEKAAVALEKLSAQGVRVVWKLSEPENFEMLRSLTDSSLNYAHAIYNAMVADTLTRLAPSVQRWSSVLPPTENYIARCRLDPSWNSNPFRSALRNCYDRLHYGTAVQDQYRSQLLRRLCPSAGR